MRYEEHYYGHRIVVTTKNTGGRWIASIDDPEIQGEQADVAFASEEEARQDALSRAASLIDRARQGQGKP